MTPTAPEPARLKVCIRGAVQGVGFRPFVFRLAAELGLSGWVNNSPQGVFLEVEGPRAALEQFLLRLEAEKPPRSYIQSLEASWHEPAGYASMEIRASVASGSRTALVMPDLATCPDCLRELFDPNDRRHRYPFINCTNCGPRFSIIEALPYDRANTSMRGFEMCSRCRAEYEDPASRRFHAEPIACPDCGPRLAFWEGRASVATVAELKYGDRRDTCTTNDDALLAAAQAIRAGQIVAAKGLGGFHLMADARNDEAVRRLRERKHREEKPLAVMFPSLEWVKIACEVSPLEERLLRSPEAPIVLLRRYESEIRNPKSEISKLVAPSNPNLGVLLPYTPLHHLLLAELGFPVLATSGNLSDEPICTDEQEALQRLAGIADSFLVHNRPIVRHVDDSIVRVMLNREMVLRRARGYAPLPIQVGTRSTASPSDGAVRDAVERVPTILAVGAHLKNTVALAVGDQVFLSQHIGDLETAESFAAFQRACEDLPKLYETVPTIIAADLHPDYLSTKHARARVAQVSSPAGSGGGPAANANAEQVRSADSQTGSLRYVEVQHHHAHVLACMAENELGPTVLGVAWDGTGLGPDATIWGGEFLRVTDSGFERVAYLRPFPLPGGDAAAREPRRTLLGLRHELAKQHDATLSCLRQKLGAAFSANELAALETMLRRNVNCPRTSSAGRLFDAVASLMGLRQVSRFEGQAAMELEFAAGDASALAPFSFRIERTETGPRVVDWAPMLIELAAALDEHHSVSQIATRFHVTLAEMIVAVAREIGEAKVVLTGGCFQNRLLTELAVTRLRAAGFKPFWHQRVPPNDGGIALGQVVAARQSTA